MREDERTITCYEYPKFSAYPGPNFKQAWGRCEKRGKGRYGVATACEAILTSLDALPLRAHKNG